MADQFGSYQWITANDLNRSVTAGHLPDVFRALRPLTQDRIEKILDLGCGFGGVGKTVGAHLNAHEVHGIDIDAEALEEARQKGLITHQVDVGREPLPFSDGYFDLVTCFGMLDYLPLLDHPIREVFRVLDRGGRVLVSLPNLAAWHNRVMLLMGYQLRDVEVSCQTLCGVHPRYRGQSPSGHIHTVTPRALSELMNYYGFETVGVFGCRSPTGAGPIGLPVRFVDWLLSFTTSLARRFLYLGRKPV